LLLGILASGEVPLAWHDWQIGEVPSLVLRLVGMGLYLLKQMAKAPGNDVAAAGLYIAIALSEWPRQGGRNRAAKAGLFSNEESCA
jgi:hypothetical protein